MHARIGPSTPEMPWKLKRDIKKDESVVKAREALNPIFGNTEQIYLA